MRKPLIGALLLGLLAAPALAQMASDRPAGSPSPVAASIEMPYGMVKGYITKAVSQVPDKLFSFKATPEVRSFAQLFGHIADSNYMICSTVAGEKPPAGDFEKTKTAKADLVKAVTESFAYCDRLYSEATEADASAPVKLFGMDGTKLGVLNFNTSHDWEHYGNIVTYMRLNKMVPPSSQGGGM